MILLQLRLNGDFDIVKSFVDCCTMYTVCTVHNNFLRKFKTRKPGLFQHSILQSMRYFSRWNFHFGNAFVRERIPALNVRIAVCVRLQQNLQLLFGDILYDPLCILYTCQLKNFVNF